MKVLILILFGINIIGQGAMASDDTCDKLMENIMAVINNSGRPAPNITLNLKWDSFRNQSIEIGNVMKKTSLELSIYSRDKEKIEPQHPTYIVFTMIAPKNEQLLENAEITEEIFRASDSMLDTNVVLVRPSEHLMSLSIEERIKFLTLAPDAIKVGLGLNDSAHVQSLSIDPGIANVLGIEYWDDFIERQPVPTLH